MLYLRKLCIFGVVIGMFSGCQSNVQNSKQDNIELVYTLSKESSPIEHNESKYKGKICFHSSIFTSSKVIGEAKRKAIKSAIDKAVAEGYQVNSMRKVEFKLERFPKYILYGNRCVEAEGSISYNFIVTQVQNNDK